MAIVDGEVSLVIGGRAGQASLDEAKLRERVGEFGRSGDDHG